jgi:hypothetical protein
MRKFRYVAVVSLLAAALAGCGGGSDDASKFSDPGTSGGNGNGAGTGNGNTTVQMGSPAGSGFSAGAMAISSNSLSAGGSTSLQVVLQQSDGTLYTQSSQVTFNSTCSALGRATITSPVTTTNGVASTTYVATGCSGNDVITATATVNGTQISATGTVSVAAAAIGSIQFESASPANIALKGTGGAGRQETSTVIFKVVDASGGPRADVDVTFSLDTSVGGINLTSTTAKSDTNGRVQTVVNAGTVATSVRVTARVASPAISTQSNQLTITTGIPDTDSVSLAVLCPNVEAFNVDGVVVPVTARLSDRFNNPVPDGTAVAFTGEGGQIAAQCVTGATTSGSGACTVNWTSSNPRPMSPANGVGRVTILATAIGEDTFSDTNSNGFYDSGETFANLGEPFRDDDESGTYTAGVDGFFLDFDNNGSRSSGDGTFSGVTCTGTGAGSTCNLTTTSIGASAYIIMSTSVADIDGPAPFSIAHDASTSLVFTIKDQNGNAMPQGSTIEITSANAGSLSGLTSVVVPCDSTRLGTTLNVTLKAPATPGSGTINVKVTSKGGIITTFSTGVTIT